MKRDYSTVKFAALVLVVIGLSILFMRPLIALFKDLEGLRGLILQFHILGPLVMTLLVALQIIVVPVPGQLAGLASGYLYGVLLGTVYSMVGIILGSTFVIWLSRRYGRPFVEHVVSRDTLEKFDARISSRNGKYILFLIYLLPLFPDDALCYMSGLTKIRIRTLVLISAVGRLPGFIVLNMVGAGVASEKSLPSLIVFGAAILVSVIVFFFRDRLQAYALRLFPK